MRSPDAEYPSPSAWPPRISAGNSGKNAGSLWRPGTRRYPLDATIRHQWPSQASSGPQRVRALDVADPAGRSRVVHDDRGGEDDGAARDPPARDPPEQAEAARRNRARGRYREMLGVLERRHRPTSLSLDRPAKRFFT